MSGLVGTCPSCQVFGRSQIEWNKDKDGQHQSGWDVSIINDKI